MMPVLRSKFLKLIPIGQTHRSCPYKTFPIYADFILMAKANGTDKNITIAAPKLSHSYPTILNRMPARNDIETEVMWLMLTPAVSVGVHFVGGCDTVHICR